MSEEDFSYFVVKCKTKSAADATLLLRDLGAGPNGIRETEFYVVESQVLGHAFSDKRGDERLSEDIRDIARKATLDPGYLTSAVHFLSLQDRRVAHAQRIDLMEEDETIPETLAEFIEFCQAKLAHVPKQFVGAVRIEFSVESHYDEGYNSSLDIWYMKPSNLAEQAPLVHADQAQQEAHKKRAESETRLHAAAERALFDALKKKYEPNG